MKYISILIIFIGLSAASAQETNVPAPLSWQHPPLAAVEATNQPIIIAPPVPPAVLTLEQLKATEEPADGPTNSVMPDRSLANLSLTDEMKGTNYVTRMNYRRVVDAIKKNNALFRLGDQKTACQNLSELLETVHDEELRYRINSILGIFYFKRRIYEDAAVHFEAAYTNRPPDAQLACNLSAAYMSYGALEKADNLLRNVDLGLVINKRLISAINFNLACINSLMDKKSDALEYLSRAADADAVFTATYIGDIQLDNIRNEKRFTTIRKKLNLMINANQPFELAAISEVTEEEEPPQEALPDPVSAPSMKMQYEPADTDDETLSFPSQ